ncbi:hypothetical protein QBC39DRAFT_341018 [Podospora conica]|nr:hypothetical protein QBC39DRAFT_341018 [Schizothecium conicum]
MDDANTSQAPPSNAGSASSRGSKSKRSSVACRRCRRLRTKCTHDQGQQPCDPCGRVGGAVAKECSYPTRGDAFDRRFRIKRATHASFDARGSERQSSAPSHSSREDQDDFGGTHERGSGQNSELSPTISRRIEVLSPGIR